MKNGAYKKIFISYRVQDTAGETGRLVDALKQHFADDQIFMDIENLEPGADFVETIEKSLDSCDVFLAVIGPHWAGEREGNLRINDPNDWVRMEVGTALRRNIRVVPVLVDGGTLPLQEQLPPDLQSLLRRQAIEITNKRWRYDTDQLIQFLIQKAGIQPLKVPQTPASQPSQSAQRKTWVYVGAGFALAFVVLIIIGLFLPGKEPADPKPGNDTGDLPKRDSLITPNVVANGGKHGKETGADNNQPINAPASLTGRWKEIDEGITSTFILKQTGSALDVQVELNGQVISTGSGTINNKNVELQFLLFGMPTLVKATLSPDRNVMNGRYTVQSTGDEQPIQLVRKTGE